MKLKPDWHPFWANRWWIVALGLASDRFWDTVVNGGFIKFQNGNTVYFYYFGANAGVWGLVTGILIGVLYSKLKAYVRATKINEQVQAIVTTEP